MPTMPGCSSVSGLYRKILGFSPDHGDGSFEAMLLVMLTTIIFGVALPITSEAAVANLEEVSSKSR
jgi:hypothetical protein